MVSIWFGGIHNYINESSNGLQRLRNIVELNCNKLIFAYFFVYLFIYINTNIYAYIYIYISLSLSLYIYIYTRIYTLFNGLIQLEEIQLNR